MHTYVIKQILGSVKVVGIHNSYPYQTFGKYQFQIIELFISLRLIAEGKFKSTLIGTFTVFTLLKTSTSTVHSHLTPKQLTFDLFDVLSKISKITWKNSHKWGKFVEEGVHFFVRTLYLPAAV